jgi:hypothetical protein
VILLQRPQWWDGAVWFRAYTPGGFDGWRTIGGRRLPCDTMFAALNAPHLHSEISRMSRRQASASRRAAAGRSRRDGGRSGGG